MKKSVRNLILISFTFILFFCGSIGVRAEDGKSCSFEKSNNNKTYKINATVEGSNVKCTGNVYNKNGGIVSEFVEFDCSSVKPEDLSSTNYDCSNLMAGFDSINVHGTNKTVIKVNPIKVEKPSTGGTVSNGDKICTISSDGVNITLTKTSSGIKCTVGSSGSTSLINQADCDSVTLNYLEYSNYDCSKLNVNKKEQNHGGTTIVTYSVVPKEYVEKPLTGEDACNNIDTYISNANKAEAVLNKCLNANPNNCSQEQKQYDYSIEVIESASSKMSDDKNFDFMEYDKDGNFVNKQCYQKALDFLAKNDPNGGNSGGNGGSGGCDGVLSQDLLNYIGNIFKMAKYIISALLIILTILDFITAISSQKDEKIKKAMNKFMKRLIAVVLIFLLPIILEFLIKLFLPNITDPFCGLI